ncbi:MAG: methyltransferase domain-containing protein [Acidobacteria bacterium]|nr:methyltransferase domain-containing protein [Acidobacteriota bacterium]
MRLSGARRVVRDLLAPRAPDPPAGFEEASARLLHARHLAAYEIARPHVGGRDVVEIGTHRGYGSRVLAPGARSFTGVDLAFDHALAARNEGGVRSIQADGQRLPLRAAAADVVVSFQVIEHVWSVPAFLREIHRILRPSGILVVSTPHARGRLLPRQMPWNEEHLREYEVGNFTRALGAIFDAVDPFGLVADEAVVAIEQTRVEVDPWAHYFAGPWGGPMRRVGGGLRRNLPGRSSPTPPEIEAVRGASDDALVKRYSPIHEGLDRALDLFAICRKAGSARSGAVDPIDTPRYWSERLREHPGLSGTGSSLAPLAWQRWLYCGKERAYLRLLRRASLDVRGVDVLDFGCGTGYFEDVWERLGARSTSGIDVVFEAIARLREAHPDRRYLRVDLSSEPADLALFGHPDLITALDVLYHIVDDDALLAVLRRLVELLPPGGHVLFTDALREQETSPHVRFRSLNQWMQILAALGLTLADSEPVFAINNHFGGAALHLPGPVGALQHFLDPAILRTMPCLANNWAVLARKDISWTR